MTPHASPLQLIIECVLGCAMLVGIWIGVGLALSKEEDDPWQQ
jgi:hypothetical protein